MYVFSFLLFFLVGVCVVLALLLELCCTKSTTAATAARTITSACGWKIKRELEHLVEVRTPRPIRTAFEIIDYFKCEISQ